MECARSRPRAAASDGVTQPITMPPVTISDQQRRCRPIRFSAERRSGQLGARQSPGAIAGAAHQQRDDEEVAQHLREAGHDRRGEQRADGLLGDDAEDDQRAGGRNHLPQRSAGRHRSGGQRIRVAALRISGSATRPMVAVVARLEPLIDAEARAAGHRGEGESAAAMPEEACGDIEEVAAGIGGKAQVRHQHEQRQRAQFVARQGFEQQDGRLDERRLQAQRQDEAARGPQGPAQRQWACPAAATPAAHSTPATPVSGVALMSASANSGPNRRTATATATITRTITGAAAGRAGAAVRFPRRLPQVMRDPQAAGQQRQKNTADSGERTGSRVLRSRGEARAAAGAHARVCSQTWRPAAQPRRRPAPRPARSRWSPAAECPGVRPGIASVSTPIATSSAPPPPPTSTR